MEKSYWHHINENNPGAAHFDYHTLKNKTFEDCVTKGSKVEIVKANYDSMSKFGVQGTPTVFINGKKWERTQNEFSLEEFKAAVEAA